MRGHGWLVLASVLLSCDVFSRDGGGGRITDTVAAPFSLEGAHTFLFASTADFDGYGSRDAILYVSDTSDSCDLFQEMNGDLELSTLMGDGSGLIFLLRMWSDGTGEWEGLFMANAYSYEESESRSMVAAAFDDSFLYTLGGYYGSGSWVRFDRVDDDALSGEFVTEYWRGSFDASNCGDLPSGYEYYYYDY